MIKATLTFVVLFSIWFGFTSIDSETGLKKHNVKSTRIDNPDLRRQKGDSVSNFSISINGKRNTIKIKTDSINVQTSKSNTDRKIDNSSIDINGQNNSVSINQKSKGKIEVKQNGNNNHIEIIQKNKKP